MHEALIRSAARQTMRLLRFTPGLGDNHQLNGFTQLFTVLFARNTVLQGH